MRGKFIFPLLMISIHSLLTGDVIKNAMPSRNTLYYFPLILYPDWNAVTFALVVAIQKIKNISIFIISVKSDVTMFLKNVVTVAPNLVRKSVGSARQKSLFPYRADMKQNIFVLKNNKMLVKKLNVTYQ